MWTRLRTEAPGMLRKQAEQIPETGVRNSSIFNLFQIDKCRGQLIVGASRYPQFGDPQEPRTSRNLLRQRLPLAALCRLPCGIAPVMSGRSETVLVIPIGQTSREQSH